jgi:hypothetical protein
MRTLKKLLKKGMVRVLRDIVVQKDKHYSTPGADKKLQIHILALMVILRPLELLHMDLFDLTSCANTKATSIISLL